MRLAHDSQHEGHSGERLFYCSVVFGKSAKEIPSIYVIPQHNCSRHSFGLSPEMAFGRRAQRTRPTKTGQCPI